jgi:hypothetical protein
MGAIGLAIVGCFVGIFGGQRRTSVPPPQLDPPGAMPPTGPSAWAWRPRTDSTSSLLSSGDTGLALNVVTSGCAANDPVYQQVGATQCALRSQSLLAFLSQTAFPGAPRRHDGSDLAALLAPSRITGESAELADSWRSEALRRVRSTTYVEEREAGWCSFVVDRETLRATCSLDRLGLFVNTPPRVDRAQTCSSHSVTACGSCRTDHECQDSFDCGCESSRCVANQCTRCSAERTCSDPTFTVRAQPWTVSAPINADNRAMALALESRPSAFRTVLQFAVLNASRDVRPGRGGTVEYDSGYRIGIRPLSFSVLLCQGDCREHFRSELRLFATPAWDTTQQAMRFHCVRGNCTATAVVLE